ncbi:MAG: thioredoxin family protein, partial [Cyanobacteria bacterium J06648_11]
AESVGAMKVRQVKVRQVEVRQVALKLGAIAIVLLSLFLSALPATAQQFPAEHVRVQLVSEMDGVRPGEPFWVGMHFEIDPDWHIYWHNPGDSGAAPTVDWASNSASNSAIDIGEFVWPYPERMPAGPLLNFGYEDEVLLMMQAELPESYKAEDVTLRGDALWLVCNEACIPEEASVELTLPVGEGAIASLQAPLFQQTRQNLPRLSPWPIRAEATGDRLALYVEAPELEAATLDRVSFFPDLDGVIVNAAEQAVAIDEKGLSLEVQRGYIPEFDSVSGVLTMSERVGGDVLTQAFEVETPVEVVSELASASSISSPTDSLGSAFGLALLGGIVLNVMPCVFPVLSLKALGILQEAGQHPQRVRTRSLWYAAGISVSVLAISVGVLLLRSLGQQVGWGFQLQTPGFVLVMAYLMFAVGLNFSGVFEIGGAFVGVGQKLTERSGYWGDFTGVFATAVATPCSAPFMATAIGVALTQPGWVAIAIFQMLGLGLALPYVVISFVPAIQSRLPKPGAWMTVVRQALAFPMYAAAAWLLWVLTQQTGSPGLAVGLSGILAIAFAAWTFRVTRAAGTWNQRAGTIAASVMVGMAIAIAHSPTPVSSPSAIAAGSQVEDAIAWEPYSAATLANYRREGKPVFVNFAADWCITCLANDRLVLSQSDIKDAFVANDVAYLKGDWTNRNPVITEALAEFGRGGVPLYVFYPPADDPVVLPQILSSDRLQQVLTQSG